MRAFRFLTMAMAWAALAIAPSRADVPVDLELVLAVDVSWSMDRDEQVLQRQGYVAAFRHPDVVSAIAGGLHGRIAVTYVEWAGDSSQQTVLPWTLVDGAGAASAIADGLAAARPARFRRTSISEALVYSAALFEANGYEGTRRVIDVSGDGPNNQGRPVTLARDALISDGVIINGLPVMIKRNNPGGYFHVDALDIYYEDCVIGGSAAFVVAVQDPSRFGEAIRRKLVLEIAQSQGAARLEPAQLTQRPPRIDCLIGEKQWLRMRENWDDR